MALLGVRRALIKPKRRVASGGGGSAPSFSFQNSGDFTAVTGFNFVSGGPAINSGDVIIIACAGTAAGSDPGSFLPTGFTAIYNAFDGASTANRFFTAYKIAGGAESGSYATPALTAGSTGSWAMSVYSGAASGVDAATAAVFAAADSLNVVAPSITTGAANERVIAVGIDNIGSTAFTDFGGGTTARVNTSTSGTHNISIMIGDLAQAVAGATGTFTSTQTFFANKSLGVTIGLKP